MNMTRHMSDRINQRAVTKHLVSVAMSFGDAVDDRIELSRQRASELADEFRANLRALERIVQKGGLVVIADGEFLITTYQARKRFRQR